MARRRTANAPLGTPGRWALTNRRFADSIHQLTEESIEQSLVEIQKEFQKRYGKVKRSSANKDEGAEPAA